MSCRGPTLTPPEATPPEVGAGEAEVVAEAEAEAGNTGPNSGTAKIGTPSHLAMVYQWMVMLTPLALPTLG